MAKRVLIVVGARPNFMKAAPLHDALRRSGAFDVRIVHTGQHYDAAMSDVFFQQLGLPQPDHHLGVGSASHAAQTAAIMSAFEPVVAVDRPDLVIVVGDVNSTLACTLVAAKLQIPVAHVEAGLRSFDRTMPEEVNRVVTDALSDLLFVTEQSGVENLRAEGIARDRVFLVGNVMIDSLVRHRAQAADNDVLQRVGVSERAYVLATLHRPSNVDEVESLERVVEMLAAVSGLCPVVWPVHVRTRHRLRASGLDQALDAAPGVLQLEPLGYLEFLRLLDSAAAVVTDSGGIQEETTFLGVPCLTIRSSTERPSTVELGTNRLVPLDPEAVRSAVELALGNGAGPNRVPPLWDGHAADRIVRVVEAFLTR